MECKTIIEYNNKGKPIWKDKVKHETLEKAEQVAELFNNKKNIFIKRQAYKCKKCKLYHVGTTTEMLLNKELPKRKKWIGNQMRIVGQVDLAPFAKKERERIKSYSKVEHNSLTKTIRDCGKLVSAEIKIDENNSWKIQMLPKSVKIVFPNSKRRYVKLNVIYKEKALIEAFTPGIKEIKNYIEKQKY